YRLPAGRESSPPVCALISEAASRDILAPWRVTLKCLSGGHMLQAASGRHTCTPSGGLRNSGHLPGDPTFPTRSATSLLASDGPVEFSATRLSCSRTQEAAIRLLGGWAGAGRLHVGEPVGDVKVLQYLVRQVFRANHLPSFPNSMLAISMSGHYHFFLINSSCTRLQDKAVATMPSLLVGVLVRPFAHHD